ncbi:DUF4331 family protein [Streptomyces zagrosensis]|uniref:DUF4331 domain-containing protein n=1 Tax=Streptomyces zagrosensis TaxID=1042984 RepID=A0A7W9V1Y4_9ACTN|nr:DUF4331 family protein [Streptomyces zagrosensis]MBB5938264.1 hypothetical protein [Streptomyces zagrosensis]
MSHHHDSLLACQDPRLNISDGYVFRGHRGTVFALTVNPLSGQGGFHDDESLYEFKIDTNGDAVEDITYRFTFSPITFAPFSTRGTQRWELRRFDGDAARDRAADGTVLLRGITGEPAELVLPATRPGTGQDTGQGTGQGSEAVADRDGGLRAWAGRAGDPLCVEDAVVTAVKTGIAQGTAPDLAQFERELATSSFTGTDVYAIVLEVPEADLGGAPEIGFWGVTVLAIEAGGWQQINRCATPLLNALFNLANPAHTSDTEDTKDTTHTTDTDQHIGFHATVPTEDRERYGPEVLAAIKRGAAAAGAVTDPAAHAARVHDLLLPDILRYEVGTDAAFEVKRRNGRGLTDCTSEVMFELVLGVPVRLGLDASAATGVLRDGFPYLAPPKAER